MQLLHPASASHTINRRFRLAQPCKGGRPGGFGNVVQHSVGNSPERGSERGVIGRASGLPLSVFTVIPTARPDQPDQLEPDQLGWRPDSFPPRTDGAFTSRPFSDLPVVNSQSPSGATPEDRNCHSFLAGGHDENPAKKMTIPSLF